jgi:hypothetical protein
VDTSQLGGTFYDTWGNAQTNYGTDDITGISFVVDGSWVTDPQTVQIDNTQINDTTYDYEVVVNEPTSKQDCKHGGWMNLTDAQGNSFENQGQCVAYVNGGGTHAHNVTNVTNTNDIHAFNFNGQNADSGRAVVKNNTTGGNANSGNARNNNSAGFNIVVSNF